MAAVTRIDYLGRFLDAVDAVQSGKAGAIADDRWLQWNHSPEFSDILVKHLDHGSSQVRTEVLVLLTSLGDTSQADKVREMRRNDVERVSAACVGYLAATDSRRRLVEELMEELRTGYGESFAAAARSMEPVAGIEDIPELRRIMAEVDKLRREMIKRVLEKVIERNPELEWHRSGILSMPLPPDAESFNSFLDKAFDYIDVRYRRNIHPSKEVDGRTRANILKALESISARHYLEGENLRRYSADLAMEHSNLGGLISWCYADLESKARRRQQVHVDPDCPRCEVPMRMYKGQWYCPGCATRRE